MGETVRKRGLAGISCSRFVTSLQSYPLFVCMYCCRYYAFLLSEIKVHVCFCVSVFVDEHWLIPHILCLHVPVCDAACCLISNFPYNAPTQHGASVWVTEKGDKNLTSDINPFGWGWTRSIQCCCCIPPQVDAAKSKLAFNNPNVAATFADKLNKWQLTAKWRKGEKGRKRWATEQDRHFARDTSHVRKNVYCHSWWITSAFWLYGLKSFKCCLVSCEL